jgi:predicted nucleotidyltransferase
MKDKSFILQLIKKSVKSTEPNAIVILYGSYARGDFKEDSDLDLLVLIDKDEITRSDQKRIKYPLYDIEFDTGTIISALIFSKKDWGMNQKITPFYENVVREGRIL